MTEGQYGMVWSVLGVQRVGDDSGTDGSGTARCISVHRSSDLFLQMFTLQFIAH